MISPPSGLRNLWLDMKNEIYSCPRLEWLDDPDVNIWAYYWIMQVSPTVIEDFLLILSIPLIDNPFRWTSTVYNSPSLHPELKFQFTYTLECQYITISASSTYANIPTSHDMHICLATWSSVGPEYCIVQWRKPNGVCEVFIYFEETHVDL